MERQPLSKAQKSAPRSNLSQRLSTGTSSAAHPLLELQRSIGNQAVQRLINSPYIQTKLNVSTPGDASEQEADRVADAVMRMPQSPPGAEQPQGVPATPLARGITRLVQREAEPPEVETEEGDATALDVQRVPLAVREDDEEEKIAPKLDPQPGAPEEEKGQTVATKLAADAPLQRQAKEDEEKEEGTLQTVPPIQRLCTSCEEDKEREEEPPGATVQRQSAPGAMPDGDDVEEEHVQAKAGQPGTPHVTTSVAANIHAMSGGGSPLPETARAFFEPRFGADFSQVRVHTDSRAVETADSINARAFTVGQHIAFGAGQYTPHSHEGEHLLAHELTHVVQQSNSARTNVGQGNEKRGLPPVSPSTDGIIQKKDGKDVKIPFMIHFDRALNKKEFIDAANAQINLDPNFGSWSNVKEHYDPSESPRKVFVDASLIKKSRSGKAASDTGFGVDDSGTIAGADDRAGEFLNMPGGTERQALVNEIDRRYWKATGIKKDVKIKDKTKQAGEVAMWNQIRDEVLAQRSFIKNLPERVQHILRYSKGGVVITPENYEQVVQIAKKIERLNAADLENYLSEATETKDLDTLETGIDNFLKTREAAPEKIKELLDKIGDEDWDTDSEAAKLDARTMFYLSLDQRIKVIKDIAGGQRVGDEDEQTIIRLLTSTPSSDLKALVEELKKSESALLKQLEKVIDGSENKDYYAALRNIMFQSLEPKDLDKKMAGAKIYPWSDPGFLKAMAFKRRFPYEVEFTKEGKIHLVVWNCGGPFCLKVNNDILEPDEIIGLYFFRDEDFAGAKEGETIFMPAANLLAFKNEQFSREMSLVVDIGLLFAGGAGLLAKGTRLAKAIAILDTTLALASITINSFRSDIAKTEEGRRFLQTWDTVNTLIAVYGIGRVVVSLPGTFKNLKNAYQNFKGNTGHIDPGDLNKIENEATQLFTQADKAAFEGEIASLRKKYSAEELAAFEKQLEKAGDIADAQKRQAALADVESQVSSQKENAALIAELKKANPGKSNKEIAELSKSRIKVPTVPHGMTAEEFQEAQDLIKKFLHDRGLKDVEGFATGSRVTGVTFNPKAEKAYKFGKISPDLSKSDLDITLITPKKLEADEIKELKALYEARFKHPLGIRSVVDKRQVPNLPMYGKIDLNLK